MTLIWFGSIVAVTWFMPLVLRLSRLRGMIWLGLFQVAALCATVPASDVAFLVVIPAVIVAPIKILAGFREPANAAPLAAFSAAGAMIFLHFFGVLKHLPLSVNWAIANGVYAFILIFGTDKVRG
jgi:hypothetical protein